MLYVVWVCLGGLLVGFYRSFCFLVCSKYMYTSSIKHSYSSLPHPHRLTIPSQLSQHRLISHNASTNLLIPSLHPFHQATGQSNVVLTGGVALNSVLNGRILREMGFDNVFVPPGCGDEGRLFSNTSPILNILRTLSTLSTLSNGIE